MSDEQVLKDREAFGKLEHTDGKVLRRHLLIDHMIDVADLSNNCQSDSGLGSREDLPTASNISRPTRIGA